MTKMLRSSVGVLALAGILTIGVAVSPSGASGPGTQAAVLALVKSSLKITTVPSSLSPSIENALDDPTSTGVDGANDILKSCNPYWTHSEATAPVPCFYGDTNSTHTVAVWGDSNAGMWVPALDTIFKAYGYRLALFGFIGCDTSFVPETTANPGFPGEWKLCNEWHASLPAAVRKLKPSIVIEVSSPCRVNFSGQCSLHSSASFNATWVKDMVLAFKELTKGAPKTLRVEIGTIPVHVEAADTCLAANPSAVQKCDVSYTSSSSVYQTILTRDKAIAKKASATLVPTFQWLCYDKTCSPIIGDYLAELDNDHVSTPYADFLTSVLEQELVAEKVLPKTP